MHEGEIHGGEAEELRGGIERLLAAKDLSSSSLQRLLDRVSARDSLAHLERCDAEIGQLRAELTELRAALGATDHNAALRAIAELRSTTRTP